MEEEMKKVFPFLNKKRLTLLEIYTYEEIKKAKEEERERIHDKRVEELDLKFQR